MQQIYREWDLLGVPIGVALISTLTLAVKRRGDRPAFRWLVATSAVIVATQVIFWVWTFPVNTATANWTVLPEGWTSLRARWEYSHAASAVLNRCGLVALALAALSAAHGERQRTG